MAPSRSLTRSQSVFVPLTLALTLALSLSFTPVNSQFPYSDADTSGSTQFNLIPVGGFVNTPGTGNGQPANTVDNFDAFIANGFKTCRAGGATLSTLCVGVQPPNPWVQPTAGIFADYTGSTTSDVLLLEYRRTPQVSSSGQVYPYGELSIRIDTTQFVPGTILNVQSHVSQIYELGTNETHYVFMDFYSGTYNERWWGVGSGIASDTFKNGYFDPARTTGVTGVVTTPAPTFLFRDVIMAESAQSYPAYTNINHNRPLPASTTFAILHWGVSSGPFTSTHPTSLFDVRLYARKLVDGPKISAYYNGPSPATTSARVYFATTQCLISGNFTTSQISIIPSGTVSVQSAVLSVVTVGANQLYQLDLTFPTGVSGDVTIQVPAGSVFNNFNLPNTASNALRFNVLTQDPHLTIVSPNYPTFPTAQQSTSINYTFVYDTDVYGFDITRVGLCQTTYENDTCTIPSSFIYVLPGTFIWAFPNGNATGVFTTDAINPKQKYQLLLSNLPDGTYRALVMGSDVISEASQNMPLNVVSNAPIRVDTIAPAVTFAPVFPIESNGEFGTYAHLDNQLIFHVNFSELVTGLNANQLNVTNGVVNTITPLVSAPNSQDPSSTWCYSTTTNPCKSAYIVQINHTGGITRSVVVLSYYATPADNTQRIFDLAGNSLNSTGGASPAVRDGAILFSNRNTSVTINPYPEDLLIAPFAVAGKNKTDSLAISYNFTFDYPMPIGSFDAQSLFSGNKLLISASPSTSGFSWTTTTQLDNQTFTADLNVPPTTQTTTINITLIPDAVTDIAGNTNLQSNTDTLFFDTKQPSCTGVTYGSQERFGTGALHQPLTNATVLTYTFTFDEPIADASYTGFGPTVSNNLTGSSPVPSTSVAATGNQVIYTLTASKPADDATAIAIHLTNITDLFNNTQMNFASCVVADFKLDYTAPNATFITDNSPFASNGTNLFIAPRFASSPAFLTKSSQVVITYQFSEAVNLVQSALLYQYERAGTTNVTVNNQIIGFVAFDCQPAPFASYCLHFNVTVIGEDTSYSILGLNPTLQSTVTDLAGNPVANNPLYIYLTDQTPPIATLYANYPLVDGIYRSNQKNVTIQLYFSKHIEQFPGPVTGICSNATITNQPLTNAALVFTGPDPTSRRNFTATFDVSNADRMTCTFTIGPNAVYDTVHNTLNTTTSIQVATRFTQPHATITTPRGWLTNDLNPIPVCVTTDTAIDVSNLFGTGGASNATANIPSLSTVPVIYDVLTGRNISVTNRTYNATSLTFCANLLPITADTDIHITILPGTIVDVYNNTNFDAWDLRIQRFDLNPGTYENLVKDGIIVNAKLANGSVTNRNLVDGAVDQRALANNSVGTNQLQTHAVQTIDIADDAVNSDEIAPNAVNATHLANNSVTTRALADSAVITSKLANSSVTSDKIVDGTIQTQDLANGSVTLANLANNSVSTDNIIDGTITTSKIANNTIVNAQLTNDSVSTANLMDRIVTEQKIAIGAVGSVELANNSVLLQHMTNGSVDSNVIVDESIQQVDLANNSVGTSELIDGGVTNSKLGVDAVTTDKILNGTIVQTDLANSSVGTDQIIDGTIQEQDLSNNSISTRTLIDGNVTNSKLDVDAVTTDKILNGTILNADLANNSVSRYNIMPFEIQWNNMGNNSIDEFNLVTDSVTTRAIRDRSVVNTSIDFGAVTNENVAPGTINTTQIQNAGVTLTNMANNSVASSNIVPQAVGTRELADLSITNNKLNDSVVNYRTIAAQSIDSTKIIPGSIQTESLAPNVVATLNYQNGSILNQFIAINAINSTQIQPGAVDTPNLAVEAVDTSKLGYQSVTGEKIAPGSISLNHLDKPFLDVLGTLQTYVPRALDGSYINDYSLIGKKLANKTVSTLQLNDKSVTVDKIADNAVTWVQIAPQTINSDNLANSSVITRNIAPQQIQPYHLASDFFTQFTNVAPNSIDAQQAIKPATITNNLYQDGSISLAKLTSTSFASLVDMFHRLALLEATVTALVNNIDSRCIFNVTFGIPAAASQPTLSPASVNIQHTMGMMHPEIVAEIQRRTSNGHEMHTESLGVQPGSSQKYPLNIQPGTPYCGDGSGSPAGNFTIPPDNSNQIISSGVAVSPSTFLLAAIAAFLAMLTL